MQARDPKPARNGSYKQGNKGKYAIATAALLIGVARSTARADTVTSEWNGNSNTTWSNSGNWGSNGVPSGTVGALFDTTFTNQPNLTANATTDGIWVATGVGQSVTINATSAATLTFGGSPIPTFSTVTTEVMMNDTAGDNLTFGPNLTLSMPNGANTYAQFDINNSDSVTIAGKLASANGNGVAFSGDGTGVVDVTGTLIGGGGGSFGLTNITMILEQDDPSLAPGMALGAGGILRLNSAGAIPTGKAVSLSGASTLQVRTDTSTTFTGNYNFNSSTDMLNLDQRTSAGSNNTVTLNGAISIGNGGSLNASAGNGYSLAISGTVTLGGRYSGSSTINPTGANMSISGNVNPVAGANVNGAYGLILSGNSSGNSIPGIISDTSGSGGQQLYLQKTGSASTWRLSGNNAYLGTTSVNAGTLFINGDQTGSTGNVTVANTATLGGTGTVGGITTVSSGGLVAPGDGTGTLTFVQNLTLNSGAYAAFGGNELANVDGTLTLTSGWKLNLNSGFKDGGSVVLFTFGSAGTLNLTPTINESNLGFTPSGSLSLSEVGNSIVLNGVSDVPEPASLGLLAVAGMMLLTRRRRD